jgi:hypothetical protein
MNKFEMIESIRELNNTASVEFLSQFSEPELQDYLDHLLELDMSDLTAAIPAAPFN